MPRKERPPPTKESVEEHSYEEVRLPPPKMFQDEPPPPEEFRDPPAIIDNPLYHVYETVKPVRSPKQTKTAPCSPQKNRERERERESRDPPYGARDICLDCYQEGKEMLQSTQDEAINFKKCKEEFKRQMSFSGKIYRCVVDRWFQMFREISLSVISLSARFVFCKVCSLQYVINLFKIKYFILSACF